MALTAGYVKQVFPGNVQSTQPAGQQPIPQWKSTPEDSTTWRREPFKSTEDISKGTMANGKTTTVTSSPELNLQGILKSNTGYFAIINGTTVKPGNRIEGWTISEISRHRVTLSREKEKLAYDIYQGKIDRGTR